MTAQTSPQMHFAVMLGGHMGSIGAWRLPQAIYDPLDFALTLRLTKIAERAKLDMIFVADHVASTPERPLELEAFTELAALISATEHIGLAGTVSTTYTEPYNVARMVASIDHMSGGRAAVNVVTTSLVDSAYNFGLDKPMDKAERYARAAEYVEVLRGLWDSWEDGAVVADKASGLLIDNSKRHPINHQGRFYKVRGPLNMTRSPQGQPVILQAGSSDVGLPFAAAVGELLFTVEPDAETSKAFCDDIRNRATALGRDASQMRILPGFVPFIGETEAKARELFEQVAALVDPDVAWSKLTSKLGIDLSGHDPDGPMPDIPRSEMRGFAKALSKLAQRHGFNLRQIRDYAAISVHPLLIGTPEMVADELERWFRMGACDGFMLLPSFLPGPVEAFCEGVIPILQKRGLFRTDYTGHTLRDHFGLRRPAHPWVTRDEAAA